MRQRGAGEERSDKANRDACGCMVGVDIEYRTWASTCAMKGRTTYHPLGNGVTWGGAEGWHTRGVWHEATHHKY